MISQSEFCSWRFRAEPNKNRRQLELNIPKKSSWTFKTFVPRAIQKSLSQNVETLKSNAVAAERERHFCDSDDGPKIAKSNDDLPEAEFQIDT